MSNDINNNINDNIGILDPDGNNLNPLTNKKYSEEYKELAKKWKLYPAYENAKNKIMQIKDNDVILVISGTGSGKTVLIPKYVLHIFNYKKKIAIVLPKQIIAKSSAEFSAKTLDVELGKEVGFKHKAEKKYSDDTKLLYTTDGSLISMLMTDINLTEYNAVIIDEAHERRTQTDLLLYLLKQVCKKRTDFKLIIMSATIDKNIFEKYFSEFKYFNMNISGKTNFPISDVYIDRPIDKSKYIEKGLEIIKKLIEKTDDGDILFFVPNIKDTFNVCNKIQGKQNFCIEIFSGITKEKEELATHKNLYKKDTDKTRKIIVATNVAESSLTIDGIKYVIDSGYENYTYFNPNIESNVIEKRFASQAQIKQRCGRTGRTNHGICYHLYTNLDYKKMDIYPKPSIQTTNIYSECLQLLALPFVQTVEKLREILIEFIEPPQKIYLDYSIKILNKLQLIENDKINKLGLFITKLQLEPIQSIACISAFKYNCIREVIAIIIICDTIKNNINEIFTSEIQNDNNMKKFEKIKKSFLKKNSDHYSLYKIFSKFRKIKKNENKLNKWINENYLKLSVLNKINKNYDKIKHDCIDKIKNYLNDTNNQNINNEKYKNYSLKKRILLSLMKSFDIAKLSDYGYETRKIHNGKISRDSFIIGTEKKILYSSINTINNNSYLQICSIIKTKK